MKKIFFALTLLSIITTSYGTRSFKAQMARDFERNTEAAEDHDVARSINTITTPEVAYEYIIWWNQQAPVIRGAILTAGIQSQTHGIVNEILEPNRKAVEFSADGARVTSIANYKEKVASAAAKAAARKKELAEAEEDRAGEALRRIADASKPKAVLAPLSEEQREKLDRQRIDKERSEETAAIDSIKKLHFFKMENRAQATVAQAQFFLSRTNNIPKRYLYPATEAPVNLAAARVNLAIKAAKDLIKNHKAKKAAAAPASAATH